MPGVPQPSTGQPVRVLHFARTALAAELLGQVMVRSGVDFRQVDSFDALLSGIADADLILLTDPGPIPASRLCAGLDALAPRPVALHILSSGREGFEGCTPPPHVTVSGVGGALAATVAEHAVALMLALRRGLHRFAAARDWTHDQHSRAALGSLEASNVVILGCGHIGRHVARRLRPFGAHLTGLSRSAVPPGDFDRTDRLDTLDAHLPKADALVLCLPLTPDTTRIIGAHQLSLLPPHAIVINVGRGLLINEAALADALIAGRLGGAGLDVFETEPLPASSPLWQARNTILTPHVAGLGGLGEDRIVASAIQALDRVLSRATVQTTKGEHHDVS
jgi:phosphoglycerate dehydrogenase-like enzyme